MRRYNSMLATLLLLAACSATDPKLLTPGTRVAVENFSYADDVFIRRFDGGPLDEVGPTVAEAAVRQLTARRCEAMAVPVATENTDADLIVSGWITKIDGGSLGGRRARVVLWIFCWPCGLATMNAGAAWFTVEGVVHRPDGTVVGRFETKGKGGGGSHDHATNQATQRIGVRIAEMVWRGEYPPLPPGHAARPIPTTHQAVPPPAHSEPVQRMRSVTDRLRELDALQREGLISADEYQERRGEILDDL
jgi:hypothetical protein